MSETPTDPRATQNGTMVAEAIIFDAISWLMKGAAQLRVCNNPEGHRIACLLDDMIRDLWNGRDILALGGNDDQKADPHRMMVAHALMNAAGHALYAGERTAAMNLAQKAMEEYALLNGSAVRGDSLDDREPIQPIPVPKKRCGVREIQRSASHGGYVAVLTCGHVKQLTDEDCARVNRLPSGALSMAKDLLEFDCDQCTTESA